MSDGLLGKQGAIDQDRMFTMWKRDEALELYRALLNPAAEKHGFSAALYGSLLLDQEGNDLDVFMVPQRQACDRAGFLLVMRRHMKDVTDPKAGDWNRDVVIATTNDEKRIDIQFTRL